MKWKRTLVERKESISCLYSNWISSTCGIAVDEPTRLGELNWLTMLTLMVADGTRGSLGSVGNGE